MLQLITLLDAKDHLRITNEDSDFDIDTKITEASNLVLLHAKILVIPATWYSGNPPALTPPGWATTACKIILSELYFNRESSNVNAISDGIAAIIPRDPTLA